MIAGNEEAAPPVPAPHCRRPTLDGPRLEAVARRNFLIEHIDHISDEMRAVIEDLWPELVYKLPPKEP
jgi:hypothetical protein